MKIIFLLGQCLFLAGIAPLVSGLIVKIKNDLRMRRGPGLWQPYYNLVKLFSKGEVISENASWIFLAAPFIVFASCLTASLFIPIFIARPMTFPLGDFFVVIFILSLGRFFLSLAGLDTGSAFGGMGSSREMFISSLAEPVAFLSIFAVSLRWQTTSLGNLFLGHGTSISFVLAGLALFMVVLAETSRLPIDNQETHLELTMIHEAMILEYSGPRLAMIEWASSIKQIVLFLLVVPILFPTPAFMPQAFGMPFYNGAMILAKIAGLAVLVALLEVLVAKMRLFRVADFMFFAFALSLTAVITAVFGV